MGFSDHDGNTIRRGSVIEPGSYAACILWETLHRAEKYEDEKRSLDNREIGAVKEIVGLLKSGLWGYKLLYDSNLHKFFDNLTDNREEYSQKIGEFYGGGRPPSRYESFLTYKLVKEEITLSQGVSSKKDDEIAKKIEFFSEILKSIAKNHTIYWDKDPIPLSQLKKLVMHWAFRGQRTRYESFSDDMDRLSAYNQ